MYGDGSDGTFNHTSGTTTLALDTKHQFTTFNVASGARLEASGVGSVLYICATESINIDGTVVAWNTQRGQNSLSVTIDGVTYTSPGTANGGNGGNAASGGVGGSQGLGFGGGGAGGWAGGASGGNGGIGGRPGGSGGAGKYVNQTQAFSGSSGGTSAGGGGGAAGGVYNGVNLVGTSGSGGSAYSSNGGNASGNAQLGGGGGGGGNAGMPGVHIALKSPSITINGTVYTRVDDQSANGTQGGAGGTGRSDSGVVANFRGAGGGGGGGGSAGNIYLAGQTVNHSSAFLGTFGGGGGPGGPGYQAGGNGGAGADGTLNVTILVEETAQIYPGPFYRVWDGTEWQYVSGKVFDESVFKHSKPTIL